MRPIKFRAWDSWNEKMLYQEKDEFVISENTIGYEWCNEGGGGIEFRDKENISLMQFTGLLDKNGKEIYEGDVVKMLDEYIDHYTLYSNHKIEFGSGTFRLENGVPLSDCLDENSDFERCEFEIIGNVWENPELLEASK